jgi:hypothetical protein
MCWHRSHNAKHSDRTQKWDKIHNKQQTNWDDRDKREKKTTEGNLTRTVTTWEDEDELGVSENDEQYLTEPHMFHICALQNIIILT